MGLFQSIFTYRLAPWSGNSNNQKKETTVQFSFLYKPLPYVSSFSQTEDELTSQAKANLFTLMNGKRSKETLLGLQSQSATRPTVHCTPLDYSNVVVKSNSLLK